MKRIVIACDGTWSRLDATYPTNVAKLAQAVLPAGPDGVPQVIFHIDGVGSGRGTGRLARTLDRALGGAFGQGLTATLEAAYRYRDPDRTLNVVVLSDGLTEQGEHQELVALIAQRPPGTRVFCLGVGNDVNQPLLRQLAEESGGLAAFISQGDDFQRQAQAFRRKLQHPAATGVKITIEGGDVYDVEPATLPNLYHGAPVRLYARYRADHGP